MSASTVILNEDVTALLVEIENDFPHAALGTDRWYILAVRS